VDLMQIDIDGLKVNLIDTDDRQVIHMSAGDGYEHDSLVAWSRMIVPGRVALDVGAYTGLFSIIAALRGATAIALEPMAANRWRLGVNVAHNKAMVTILPCAASDQVGTALLHYNRKVPLTTGASLQTGALHNDSIEVLCQTIDALALKDVGAIKIDVERHEPAVLRGAMQTIERDRPSLLIETLDDDMRIQVLHLLPSYSVAAILDKRNTMFIPK
jgi:FkbM family methyltransferase